MMNITFRCYLEIDRDVLLQLTKKLEEHTKALDPLKRVQNLPGFSEIALEETLQNVAKYRGKIWFAEDGGRAIGFITGVIWKQSEKNHLEIGEHTVGEVLDLYLEPEYRGKGIGTKMLSMIEEYFKEQGCDSIWVGVFAANEIAYRRYKKLGFVEREIGMLKEI